MKIVPLPNAFFENSIFHGDVVKFNTVAKVALVTLGLVAIGGSLAAAYCFSATWLPVAGGILSLTSLLAAKNLVFHNKRIDRAMNIFLAGTSNANPTIAAISYRELARFYNTRQYLPEFSPEVQIRKEFTCLQEAAVRTDGKAYAELAFLYRDHGLEIAPELLPRERIEKANAFFQSAAAALERSRADSSKYAYFFAKDGLVIYPSYSAISLEQEIEQYEEFAEETPEMEAQEDDLN